MSLSCAPRCQPDPGSQLNFYAMLNHTLREVANHRGGDHPVKEPCRAFLDLIHQALEALPSDAHPAGDAPTVWRGVKGLAIGEYQLHRPVVWRGLTSGSTSRQVTARGALLAGSRPLEAGR